MKLTNCYDCGAKPGEAHIPGCYVERCSVCGGQKIQCGCDDHDPLFSRWSGIWPGAAEAHYMGLSLDDLDLGLQIIFFVKPDTTRTP